MTFDAERVRADFPIMGRLINGKPLVYLDNSATTQKPQVVIDALSRYYAEQNANIHRGVHTLSVEATDAYAASRVKMQRLINAPAEETVIWTRGTTEGLNLVIASYGAANVKAGDNLVISHMEHHSNLVPWQQLAAARSAELRYIPLTDEGYLDMEVAARVIDARTAMVGVSHMSNVLGTITPVRQLADMAHASGAALVVDAAQSVPHFAVDVQALDCDFLTFSVHKMLGPTGVGVLYGKRELLEAMPPVTFGGDMISEVSYTDAKWNELPFKFEAGTPNIADVIATAPAIDYLNTLGMEAVAAHERELTTYALGRLAELKNFTLLGPRTAERRGGVLSFLHSEIHAHEIGMALDQLGIAVRTGHHCAMPLVLSYDTIAATRASFYIYNTRADVDSLIAGLEQTERYFQR